MSQEKAKLLYTWQKAAAKRRGIEWHFTFDSWRAWWGDDLSHRGVHGDQLSMQRKLDRGPYASWNVTKGTNADNQRTRWNVHWNAEQERLKREREIALNHAAPTDEDDRPPENELGYSTWWRAYG